MVYFNFDESILAHNGQVNVTALSESIFYLNLVTFLF